ncbi:putative membrane protein [Microbacterium phyllosphaerae]|uniref:Membrane protein n=1 Tax=Microbacterium phyllosphaerae TaxID=124798 RepID=A0ABS4WME1_9MICO|nr:DoxX family membrane protein [Microbacterium phyllosphaerae]MBP2377365.1 putative membrane protein [Microbacterium phyllosphaerae]
MSKKNVARTVGRIFLGSFLVFAGVSHLTFAREEFQAQVPDWVPLDPDVTVLASGVVEVGLGAALLVARKRRGFVGVLAALFFVAVFPGNIAQWLEHRDAFGLDTDTKRFVRLFFQPVLIALAIWSTRTPRRTSAGSSDS